MPVVESPITFFRVSSARVHCNHPTIGTKHAISTSGFIIGLLVAANLEDRLISNLQASRLG
jgi:hypothetical protein